MVMRFVCVISVFLLTLVAFGQEETTKKNRFPSYFGLTVSPIFPSNFIGTQTATFLDTSLAMTTVFKQKAGITFGATVRIGVTKLFSIETGIFQVRRNFDVSIALPDSNLYGKDVLTFVSYDVPINLLTYVQLSKQWYMNASLGLSITHNPSDISDSILPGGQFVLQFEGRRVNRTHFATNAGMGFEYRTKKYGTFYFGASGKIPFRPIMLGVGIVKRSQTSNKFVAYGRVNGSYFSVDFRYFFPIIRPKGTQFVNGPIEQ